MKNLLLLILCLLICLAAGYIGSFSMDGQSYVWYSMLNKSQLNPPDWVFAPVWTFLYITLGLSLWLVLQQKDNKYFRYGVYVFAIQLILNALWTKLFFGLHDPFFAYLEILLLDIFVIIMVFIFGKISRLAQLVLLPYVIWLGLASYLNWYILYYN